MVVGLGCVLMDKVGCRIFLWFVVFGMCVFFVILGVYFLIYIFLKDGGLMFDIVFMFSFISYLVLVKDIFWLLILCIVLFNLMFFFVWGFVVWFVMVEINFLCVCGFVCSLVVLINWLMVFVVIYIYNFMVNVFII